MLEGYISSSRLLQTSRGQDTLRSDSDPGFQSYLPPARRACHPDPVTLTIAPVRDTLACHSSSSESITAPRPSRSAKRSSLRARSCRTHCGNSSGCRACANRSSSRPATAPSSTASPMTGDAAALVRAGSRTGTSCAHTSRSRRRALYRLQGTAAIEHLFAVACGLDSLVLGEPQILGQLKDAYRAALRPEGDRPLSQPPAAERLLGREARAHAYAHRRQRRVGRLGGRRTGAHRVRALCRSHRAARRRGRNHRACRAAPARQRARPHDRRQPQHRSRAGAGFRVQRLRDRPRRTRRSLAGSRHRDQLDRQPDARSSASTPCAPRLRARKRKPIFMVDIAVPRDIEPEVAKLEGRLPVHDRRPAQRREREPGIAARSGARCRRAARDRDRAVRAATENARSGAHDQAVARGRRCSARSRRSSRRGACSPPAAIREIVLEFLATTLTNRLMHAPSQRLRDAAERGDAPLLDAARTLFATDRTE